MIDDLIEKLLILKKESKVDNPPVFVQVNNVDSTDFYEVSEGEVSIGLDKDGWIGLVLDNGGGNEIDF